MIQEKPEQTGETGDNNYEKNSRDSTLPQLEEYLRERKKTTEPGHVKMSRIIGIDFQLPFLAMLEIICLGLIVAVMFFNFSLNETGELIKDLKLILDDLMIINNIYFYCLLFMILGGLTIWGYNLIAYGSRKFIQKKIFAKSNLPYYYGLLVFFLFLGISIVFFYSSLSLGIAWSMLLLLFFPIYLGIIGILAKNRYIIIFAVAGIIITTLIYQNDLDEIIDMILFAALIFIFLEITDSMFKFHSVYSELDPERDVYDNQLMSKSITNYLLVFGPILGLTMVLTFVVFYSQPVLNSVLPAEVTNSLEFNSAIFFIIPFVTLILIIIFSKWLFRRILTKISLK
jgi:hypothetical protein